MNIDDLMEEIKALIDLHVQEEIEEKVNSFFLSLEDILKKSRSKKPTPIKAKKKKIIINVPVTKTTTKSKFTVGRIPDSIYLTALRDKPHSTAELMEKFGVKESTVTSMISNLNKTNRVTIVKIDGKYVLKKK